MFLLRIVVFFISLLMLTILAYPLLLILDISQGGTYFGLCSDLATCEIGFLEGPRLLIILIMSFFVLVVILRLIMKLINNINNESSIL